MEIIKTILKNKNKAEGIAPSKYLSYFGATIDNTMF